MAEISQHLSLEMRKTCFFNFVTEFTAHDLKMELLFHHFL